ncbi:endoribonuclease Dicer isoform X2 [Venturia canescens]|uniref:endoribonuclease Dicer isoform X2 n=1 Tax=Venturia canescens TaxID=32260 RepID=UPI001C9CEB9B|nr:endoribonuclease Dicer isoform X2 [Venturia canescens]
MEDFTPRAYQIDLYEKAVAQNTIIYLPTGSGKTYIAVMLIKKYSDRVQLPYSKGGKRIIFAVNTVPLVSQQSEYIARHTGLACKGFSGDMGVDYWSKEDWLKEIEDNQVLVLVAEICLSLIQHGIMRLSDISLLIFDECHKAVGNHPMRNIMKRFESFDSSEHPRILGLTATLLNANVKVEKVEATIRDLEITLHSRVATANSYNTFREYGNLDEKFVRYNPPTTYGIEVELGLLFDYAIGILDTIKLKGSFDCELSSKELSPKPKNLRLKNLIEDAREHINTMGLYGGSKCLLLHMIQLESMKKTTDDLQTMTILEFLITQLTKMRKIIEHKMDGYSELNKIFKFSSDQVLKTVESLKHFNSTKDDEQKFCCIVFVQRRVSARVLYNILKNLQKLNEQYSFLVPDYILGYTNNPYKNPREALCLSKWNKEALLRFRSGHSNCLVATDVVDEGVDVPTCTLIVRYDLPLDFRSYVQSKGRARHKSSRYIMLISSEDKSFPSKHKNFQRVENLMKMVSLTLPSVSPLNHTIEGDVRDSIAEAKRSAALKACVELHKIGELTNHLLPVEPSAVLGCNEHLFPHWEEEKFDPHVGIPGTASKKRIHPIKHPESLNAAFPVSKRPLYLHLIQAKPSYPKPYENRQWVFYEMLCDDAGFGLVTTKPIPQIPGFPIFMNVGELKVNLKVNHSVFEMSEENIAELVQFHWLIFHKVLNIIKSFMVFDTENKSNSFLVVPTDANGNLCWSTIQKYKMIEETPPSEPLNVFEYDQALIKPSYRSSSSVYVVTQVCDDLMAESPFPNGDYHSYMHYYKDRHGLTIRNPKQPMLEVKAISKKIDCIRPRGIKAGLSKRKCADILEDFEEHFVAELCNRTNFSALYWLKASYLPSVLHRVCQLLVAEDLRAQIVREARLGVMKLEGGSLWPPVVIKSTDIDEHPELLLEVSTADESFVELSASPIDIPGPEIDTLESNLYPWKKESEPINLYGDIEKIQLIDIEYYHQFMATPLGTDEDEILKKRNRSQPFATRPKTKAPVLEILNKNDEVGPSPAVIMQALTSKSSHDVFDLERLETLGDSLLKFAVSLFLYETYPEYGEGQLTVIKGKMVGNRNLYYCGTNKQIPGRMKVERFEPMCNFISPAFTVMRPLQNLLLSSETSPNVLYEIMIPSNEQLAGIPSNATLVRMEEIVSSWNEENAHTGMEPFLDVQSVPDKSVSDGVEALIGVYLNTMGLTGAFKILTWFNILPLELRIDDILRKVSRSPRIGTGNPDDHMPQADYIQKQIGYKFNDRAYLLQAFTHPSYTPNNITPGYERLEFLGDAVLDFLITVHIYESCDYLSPGALTDLRSALVNNITFACLAVKYGFHTALMAYAPKLQEIIERFVKFQADRDFIVDDELLWILLEEEDCKMAEFVDVPKILGDLFESVIGAIYLDTGKNLHKVWEIVYTMMQKEITTFSKQVPKQPIRVIHETPGANPKFTNTSTVDGTQTVMVTLEVTIAGKTKTFHGFGANKKQAKCAAAKQALKCIRSNV